VFGTEDNCLVARELGPYIVSSIVGHQSVERAAHKQMQVEARQMLGKATHDELEEIQGLHIDIGLAVLEKDTAQHGKRLKHLSGRLRGDLSQLELDNLFNLDDCFDTLGRVWKFKLVDQVLVATEQFLDLLRVQRVFSELCLHLA